MRGKRGQKTVAFRRLKLRHEIQLFFASQLEQSRGRTGHTMLPPLAALIAIKSGVVPRVASLLCLSLMPAMMEAQGHELKIRVINAKTGQPITDERLNVALRVDQIGSVAMGTDKKGIISVDVAKATTIRILSNMYADCRPRSELYTNYSIETVMKSGITTGNLCGGHATAKPGELVLFEVPKTYIPTFPNPPVTSMPHSDENPHEPPK
jgi:hypothetical protein